MKLDDLGYNSELEKFRLNHIPDGFEPGRVTAEHKERYMIMTAEGEFEAEITGNMRFTAKNREDFPAVGDWVASITYDSGIAVIHKIFPRLSILKRQATGQTGEVQVIAANIDYAFLVQAVDRDFNINRLERYLTLCNSSGVSPVIVLSKIDLVGEEQLSGMMAVLEERIKNVPVITISNETQAGYDRIRLAIKKGKTYCMLGSSGAGKSSLLNNLSGATLMRTGAISRSTNRGRHVTSHRELIVLENGGILIDNPGMREVGIASSSDGLEVTFETITSLSRDCKFKDCTHTHETDCAVLEAVNRGEIDKASYANYLKMEREKAHFESTVEERRQKDKDFGKMFKNYKKNMNRNSK
ncbi:MAG: ribosome small subunit-dependent GTPase A [Bacteroidales bacterium]|nr:ribosome small subunit-dependent GTPase A [Bacteroidales bacterium]